eukprot:5147334-Heterocapsa_arctica.AAC.1
MRDEPTEATTDGEEAELIEDDDYDGRAPRTPLLPQHPVPDDGDALTTVPEAVPEPPAQALQDQGG